LEDNPLGYPYREEGERRMYSIPQRGYIGKNPVKWFRVLIWDFDVRVKSDSRGSARYEAWLNFHDAYDIPFGEFCKQSRVVIV
jgi:hypothetical protein